MDITKMLFDIFSGIIGTSWGVLSHYFGWLKRGKPTGWEPTGWVVIFHIITYYNILSHIIIIIISSSIYICIYIIIHHQICI